MKDKILALVSHLVAARNSMLQNDEYENYYLSSYSYSLNDLMLLETKKKLNSKFNLEELCAKNDSYLTIKDKEDFYFKSIKMIMSLEDLDKDYYESLFLLVLLYNNYLIQFILKEN